MGKVTLELKISIITIKTITKGITIHLIRYKKRVSERKDGKIEMMNSE